MRRNGRDDIRGNRGLLRLEPSNWPRGRMPLFPEGPDAQPVAGLQALVDRWIKTRSRVRVLDAGCGSILSVSFGDHATKVGIDISARQLQQNTTLSEKILGDIQTYRLPAASFDAIVCWDVLEHLPYPKRALERFARAVKPEGLIILKLPNVLSLKGLVTKTMPQSLHVLFYRYVLRRRHAGSEDTGPFRTYLRFSIRPKAISRYAIRRGLSVVYTEYYDIVNAPYLQRRRALHAIYSIAWYLAHAVSLGILGASDYVVVLRKDPT